MHELLARPLRDRRELETEQPRNQLTPQTQKASQAIDDEIRRLISEAMGDPQEILSLLEQAQKDGREPVIETSEENLQWLKLLDQVKAGLVPERRLPLTEQTYPAAHAAYVATQDAIEEIGEVTAPGKYDRLTQWAFILCLPCAPYFFWFYATARRQVYRLDDDGELHLPQGTWKADQISDIDMSRWMAKSIAQVVHRDGSRVKLDDYKFRNLHLIIGAIASRLYPDDWDAEARPIDRDAASASAPQAPDHPSEAPPEAGTPLAQPATPSDVPGE